MPPSPVFTVWYFATKCATVKFTKPWMSNHFSESRDPKGNLSQTPRKKLSRLVLLATPTGKRPKGRPRTRWNDYISDFAWSSLGAEPVQISEIAVDREASRVLLGLLAPRPSISVMSGHDPLKILPWPTRLRNPDVENTWSRMQGKEATATAVVGVNIFTRCKITK